MSKMAQDGRRYELMYIIQPGLTEAARKKLIQEIATEIENIGGKVFHEDDWGLRDFAYTIGGHSNGYYFIRYFNGANPKAIADLDRDLRLNQDIVRHVIFALPKEWEMLTYETTDELDAELQASKASKVAVKTKKTVEAKSEDIPAKVDKKKLDDKLDQIMKDDDLGF